MKAWVLCDSKSGYIYNFYVFTGTGSSDSTADKVILDQLMKGKGLEGNGNVLFTDNWFSSTYLSRELWKRYGCYFCGVHKLTGKKGDLKVDDFQAPYGAISPPNSRCSP